MENNITFSNLAVEILLSYANNIKKIGFKENLLNEIKKDIDTKEIIDIEDTIESIKTTHFVPDAYLIDKDKKTVYIFEIEDTNKLSINKLYELVYLWECLDYIYWELRVIVTDRYLYNWRNIDLCKYMLTIARLKSNNKTSKPDTTIDLESIYNNLQ